MRMTIWMILYMQEMYVIINANDETYISIFLNYLFHMIKPLNEFERGTPKMCLIQQLIIFGL